MSQPPQYPQNPQYPEQPQYSGQPQYPQYPAQPQYPGQQYPGQQYPGQPQYPAYQQPVQRKPGTNGFAIASLIFGIIGGILLSVIFGIVALVQVRKSGQRGKGLAIAGLILSGIWTLILGAAVIYAINSSAERDDTGAITKPGSVSVFDLKVGDCFNGLKESEVVYSVDAVPCAQPHDGEVFGLFDLTGSTFPGEQSAFQQAEKGCNDRLEAYSAKAISDDSLQLYVYHPTKDSWSRGDRGVTCVIGNESQQHTGSARD